MPWQESATMDLRLQFVRDALSERFDMTELCLRYGVSRRIGYKWLARFTEAFAEGKEVGPEVAAEMVAWLLEERPAALSGRVVSALLPPEVLATRIDRIEADDLGKLRLR